MHFYELLAEANSSRGEIATFHRIKFNHEFRARKQIDLII